MNRQRNEWLTNTVAELAEVHNLAFPKSTSTRTMIAAIRVMTPGISYLLGQDADSMNIPTIISARDSIDVVDKIWRNGALPPRFARQAIETYVSLFACARDVGALDPRELQAIDTSVLHQRLRQLYHEMPQLSVNADHRWDSIVESLPDKRDHITQIARLLHREPRLGQSTSGLTSLEIRDAVAAINASDERREEESLHRWFSVKETYKWSNGWPSNPSAAAPSWVVQKVTERNARFFPALCGATVAFVYVAETSAELDAFMRWTYEPLMGLEQRRPGTFQIILHLPIPDEAPIEIFYHFDQADWVSHLELLAVIFIGAVRLDCYLLDSLGQLEYVTSYGSPIRSEIIDYISRALPMKPPPLDYDEPTRSPSSEIVIKTMEFVDSFDREISTVSFTPHSGFESEDRTSGDHLADARTRYWKASHQAFLQDNTLTEQNLLEARDDLLVELSRTSRSPVNFAPRALASTEAYIQISYNQSLNVFAGDICYTSETNADEYQGCHVEFTSLVRSPLTGSDGHRTRLNIPELDSILDRGLTTLFVSVRRSASEIAWHQYFLDHGFNRVIYIPSLNWLSHSRQNSVDSPQEHSAFIQGFAGVGKEYLEAVDAEIRLVSALYSSNGASLSDCEKPVSTVHLAGHGHTGDQLRDVLIAASDDAPLSAANVLLGEAIPPADLVVLSGCSTGSIPVKFDRVVNSLSLEDAFLQSGSRVVISTCLPINDFIALVFAYSFHQSYLTNKDPWIAFEHGIQNAKGNLHTELEIALEGSLPGSVQKFREARAAHPEQWRFFRISGDVRGA